MSQLASAKISSKITKTFHSASRSIDSVIDNMQNNKLGFPNGD